MLVGEGRYGSSGSPVLASDTVASALLDAAEDETVRAILFRIDSPGGSALASDIVWQAGERGVYDKELLAEALARLKERPLRKDRTLQQLVKKPVLFVIDYRDGVRACVLTLNGALAEWTVAWRNDRNEIGSTLFWTQESRPFQHFGHLLAGIEAMISYLKRCFGLSRCNWKGLDHFKAYVHSAVFTHNLVVLTRRLAPD